MQEIFINGKIYTNDEKKSVCESMFVNDGIVVFSGEQEEILKMKTNETKIIDLKNKFVYPAFFGLGLNVFSYIEENLKNANNINIDKNSADNDENYEKFSNYSAYKKEFVKIQDKLISNGITTIQELKVNKRAFTFFKKLAEDEILKIDICGYVEILSSKIVMDENCSTYRTYKNHLRLGGYYLKLDGKINELKAWLSKPYKHTKDNCGFGECYGEQLFYLVKTALEEKKQVVFDANGDKAIEEVLKVFDEVYAKQNFDSSFRPIIFSDCLINKKAYQRLKKNEFVICFKQLDFNERKYIGYARMKHLQNIKYLQKNSIKYMIALNNSCDNVFDLINYFKNIKLKNSFKFVKNNAKYNCFFDNLLYNSSAYAFFDQNTKGSLETQKQANFVVLDNDLYEPECEILKTYLLGEEQK